jgi:hypothetical protein
MEPIDAFGLATQWNQFDEDAGKEGSVRRRRASLVLTLLLGLLQDALRISQGVAPLVAGNDDLEALKKLAARLGPDQLVAWIDRAMEADVQVGRMVQLDLVVEAYADSLTRSVAFRSAVALERDEYNKNILISPARCLLLERKLTLKATQNRPRWDYIVLVRNGLQGWRQGVAMQSMRLCVTSSPISVQTRSERRQSCWTCDFPRWRLFARECVDCWRYYRSSSPDAAPRRWRIFWTPPLQEAYRADVARFRRHTPLPACFCQPMVRHINRSTILSLYSGPP